MLNLLTKLSLDHVSASITILNKNNTRVASQNLGYDTALLFCARNASLCIDRDVRGRQVGGDRRSKDNGGESVHGDFMLWSNRKRHKKLEATEAEKNPRY